MFKNYKFYTDEKNKVIATSTYAGRTVRGVAKCSDEDKFDLEKGKQLAAARCETRVATKRCQRANKKLIEARKAAIKAMDHYMKMEQYYNDAKEAVTDAIVAENQILETL